MLIRPLTESDLPTLHRWHRKTVAPEWDMTLGQLRGWLTNGRSFTLLTPEQKPIGYVVAHAVPGLPHDMDVSVMVAEPHQGQGWGRQLMNHLRQTLALEGVQRLNASTKDASDGLSQFWQSVGFELHHEEVSLVYEIPMGLPPLKQHTGKIRRVYEMPESASLFCQLYDASFGPHPWYQPYTVEEVQERWTPQDDLLFLYEANQPIGFVWMQYPMIGSAIVEPIGIVPEAVGQGNGRYLLSYALYRCAQNGVDLVRIGAWGENETAVSLYQSLGFQEIERSPHWVLELGSKPPMS